MKKELITKTLYIPYEIFDREISGALILAVEATLKGWTVILGGKQAIFENIYRFSSSPGVFYLKSIVPGEVFKQNEITSYGHRIVSLDIEGLVRTPGSAGVKLRYSEESISKCDIVYFWGEDHYNSVKEIFPKFNHKFLVTGGLSIDDLIIKRSKFREDKHKSLKILVATSCAYANNINGKEFPIKMTKMAYSGNLCENEISKLELNALRDIEIFNYWKETIPIIATMFPNVEVVVRPHPTENANFWKRYLKRFQNVRIDYGTPLVDELINSSVFIHFNSTSAISAKILGIPVVMVMPNIDKQFFDNFSFVKEISETASTNFELQKIISTKLEFDTTGNVDKELYYFCENLKPNSFSASIKIVKSLDDFYEFSFKSFSINPINLSKYLFNRLRKIKFFIFWLSGYLFRAFRMKSSIDFPPKNAYKSSRNKQPDINRNKLLSVLNKIYDFPILKKLEIKELSTNIFKITLNNE